MIGLAMEKWPDDALRRVVDAPVERWADGAIWGDETYASGGCGCLAFHRFGVGVYEGLQVRVSEDMGGQGGGWAGDHPIFGADGRFERLLHRCGKLRTVRAIKQRALKILLDRHPLTPVSDVLVLEGVEG